MATLYVRNVPDDLYKALRNRAKANRRSIAAEVLVLLQENVPTEKELRARRAMLRGIIRSREKQSETPGPFPSAEEMIREDRKR